MSNLVPQNFGAVSTKFQQVPVEDDLSSGIQSSYGIIGYKGKVWSIRYRGDEQQLMREDGDGPRSSIEVVVLKASKHISKVWYKDGYVEGSNAAPDCFSNNGITPEPTSTLKQCDTCALCPHNQWGSRITPAGKQGKACADSKRIAVSPLSDIANEMFGGPMLLRVPAASLQDLAMYGQKMQQLGYPYYSVGTRIQFDPAESFPKFKISAIRPLTDQEADIVLGLRDGHTVDRILSESEYAAAPGIQQAQPDASQVFEQPPAQVASQPAPQPAQQAVQQNVTPQGNGFGATKPAQEVVQPKEEDAKAKRAAELKAELERLEREEQEAAQQAAAMQAVQEAEPVETDEEREIREMEEKMRAMKAKAAERAKTSQKANTGNAQQAGDAKPATTQSSSPDTTQASGTANPSNSGQTVTNAASPSEPVQQDAGANMASDFEANLDSMLADLLPGG